MDTINDRIREPTSVNRDSLNNIQLATSLLFSMDGLPLEIKTEICSYLDHGGLIGFSAANKRCRLAAHPILFRRLRIWCDESPADLETRIIDILASLQRGEGAYTP